MKRLGAPPVLLTATLALALALPACGEESMALVQKLVPLNGSTAQKTNVQPLFKLRDRVIVQAGNRGVVLYDVTKGAKTTVSGEVSVEGALAIYVPKAALKSDHDYLMEVKKSAVAGTEYELLDGTESPEEPVVFPLQFHFSTRSAPRVRAAYLEQDEGGQRLTVRFSQPMAPVSTGLAVQLLDGVTHKALPLGAPVWASDSEVRLRPSGKLDGTLLYTLKVAVTARSADNTALDGDHDGTPGEAKDHFCVGFSGIQKVIFSRMGTKKPSTCP